jgi:hypothetical protein
VVDKCGASKWYAKYTTEQINAVAGEASDLIPNAENTWVDL